MRGILLSLNFAKIRQLTLYQKETQIFAGFHFHPILLKVVARKFPGMLWFQVTIVPRMRIADEESKKEYYDLDEEEGEARVHDSNLVHR